MGGRGSGGRRIGAGRKPKHIATAKLHGSRQRSKPARAAATVDVDTGAVSVGDVPMPDDLSAGQAAAWMELAPHALKLRTLTPETAGAFREDLCCNLARLRQIRTAIDVQGLTGLDGNKNPLLVEERAFSLRVEAARARFMLAPLGKSLIEDEKPVDPWAAFDGPQLVKGNKK